MDDSRNLIDEYKGLKNEQVFDERYPDFERIYYHNYYAYYYWEK